MSTDIEVILPNNMDEAIETFKLFYENSIDTIKNLSEKDFISSNHFGAGMFIRNSWFLWWHEGHAYPNWPKEKPKLIEYFHSINIYHADDISSILLTSLHRHLNNKPLEIEQQAKNYIDYWKNLGYKNGNPMENPTE